jgi:hypothetical protein
MHRIVAVARMRVQAAKVVLAQCVWTIRIMPMMLVTAAVVPIPAAEQRRAAAVVFVLI